MEDGTDVRIEGLNLCEGEDKPKDLVPAELKTTGKLKEVVTATVEGTVTVKQEESEG